MTTREKLEQRHRAAESALRECGRMFAIADRVALDAEITGHTSLVGEVAAVRRALRALRRRATIVRDRLNDRIKSEC